MMESFEAYKRNTSAGALGYDATNWGHATNSLTVSGKTYKLSALSLGGRTYLQLFSGAYANNNGQDNIYVTLYGSVLNNAFNDGFYHYSIVYKKNKATLNSINANNVHINLQNMVVNSDFMGINQGLAANATCKFFGVYFYNVEIASASGFVTPVYNTKTASIDEAIWIFDGDNSGQLLQNIFLGGTLETTENHTSSVVFNNIYVGVYNDASITKLFGGGNQFAIEVNIKNGLVIDVENGKITDLYGGSQGGTITSNYIELNINGGKITNIYGGGAGGFVTCNTASAPKDLTGYKTDENYKFFTNSSGSTIYVSGISYGLKQQEVVFD